MCDNGFMLNDYAPYETLPPSYTGNPCNQQCDIYAFGNVGSLQVHNPTPCGYYKIGDYTTCGTNIINRPLYTSAGASCGSTFLADYSDLRYYKAGCVNPSCNNNVLYGCADIATAINKTATTRQCSLGGIKPVANCSISCTATYGARIDVYPAVYQCSGNDRQKKQTHPETSSCGG
jgi:hypothetical protein